MPGHSECAARIPAILSALELSQLTSLHKPLQVHSLASLNNKLLDAGKYVTKASDVSQIRPRTYAPMHG